ncbi:hypothetical protein LUZ60_010093 [Juncus effusus]|nr:hypothetical protein LUZ60_010093 [Juncus effusus]
MNWPILGVLPSVLTHLHHFHDLIVQALSASGLSLKFRGPRFTGMDMFITCDPDNVNYVFNTHEKLYPKGGDLTDMFGALGDCLLTTEGEKWSWHRRTMRRILGNRKFQEFELQDSSTKIESCLIPMLERCAQENKVIDLQDVFLRFIFDTVCATFLGVDPGSTDTTGGSLAWFFWLLSKHPDVEKKIINELNTIFSRQENLSRKILLDRNGLHKLVYLHGAICESLRLYPPVPFQHKCASQADVLPSGHRVKPGMFLIFHTYSMGRMRSVWGEDCMEFKPERWINQKGEIKHEPANKFFAFNCGSRICLGKEMAINKMKMVISAMIYNFHVEVVQGHVVEPKLGVMLHMKNGLMVRVRKRGIS